MFLAVDKPARITSFDVIRIFRRHFTKQKIGHSWTLDPMATGLMILALGDDTKKCHQHIHVRRGMPDRPPRPDKERHSRRQHHDGSQHHLCDGQRLQALRRVNIEQPRVKQID